MNIFLSAGALLGLLAVIIGAFGAHGLEGILSEHALKSYQTGVKYHFYHVTALLCVGILCSKQPSTSRFLKLSGIGFIVGILLFSGSLYLLAITGISKLGIITPFGGLALIFGWVMLLIYGFKQK